MRSWLRLAMTTARKKLRRLKATKSRQLRSQQRQETGKGALLLSVFVFEPGGFFGRHQNSSFQFAEPCGNMPRQAAVPITSARVSPTVALLSRATRPNQHSPGNALRGYTL